MPQAHCHPGFRVTFVSSRAKSVVVRYFFEHLAVCVCAITGVLAAKNKSVDLFGVVVLAVVTALGGGTLRDLILGTRPFWLVDSSFVVTATLTAGVLFVVSRFWDMPPSLLLVPDAFGLALFTVIGTQRALSLSATTTVAVMLGVITGVAGGMIRDLLTGEIPLVLRTG